MSHVSRIGAIFHLLNSSIEELLRSVCAPLCEDLLFCSGVICGQGESFLTVTFKPGSAVSPALTLIETDGVSEAQPQDTSSELLHTQTHTAICIQFCIYLLRQPSQLLLLILDPKHHVLNCGAQLVSYNVCAIET